MVIARILNLLVVVLFGFCVDEILAGEYCTTSGRYYSLVTYCRYGCCGSVYDRYCCSVNVALIVGCVIGGILFICVIIAAICCCIKKQTHKGRVVQPGAHGAAGGPSNVVVFSGSSSTQPYYGAQPMGAPTQAMPPPVYKQFEGSNPPPAYNYADPAYPPAPTYPPPPPPPAAAGGGPVPSAPANPNPFSAAAQGTSTSAPLQPPPPGFNVGGPAPGTAYSAPPPAATTK